MENAILPHDRSMQPPLASCEARARLALERGQISRSTYLTLMGITAEVQLNERSKKDADGAAETATKAKATTATGYDASEPAGVVSPLPPRQQMITPYDTPMDTPQLSRNTSGASAVAAVSPSRISKSVDPKLELPQDYVTINDKGGLKPKPRTGGYAAEHSAERASLDKIREHGFGLSDRAKQYWANHNEGDGTKKPSQKPATKDVNEKSDQRLEQFVDICLKTYPPARTTPAVAAVPAASSDNLARQKLLGLMQRQPPYNPTHNLPTGTMGYSDNTRWDTRYEELLQFKSIHGHCNVPFRYEHNRSLGGWVQKQRDFNKKGKLLPHRVRLLQQAGFAFVLENKKLPKIKDANIHSYDDLWDKRYNCLVDYKLQTGHCNVPYRWAENKQLGRWVQNQREFYKRGTLSSERYSRLMALGFQWAIRKSPKKKTSGAKKESTETVEKPAAADASKA